MKLYEHEDSPCDDIFKGVIAYEEILDRFIRSRLAFSLSKSTDEVGFPRYFRENR
jgi:hypothetical protein